MNELKALPNESWESFVVRVLSNPSLFNMDKQTAISTLLNVDHCLENIRKMGYLLRDIEKAKKLGLHHKFMSEYTEEIHTMYKSDELNSLEEIEKELELVYNKLGKNEKTILNLRDNNTMLRRLIREDTRDENSLESTLNDIYSHFKSDSSIPSYDINIFKTKKPFKSVILQLNDIHHTYTAEEENEMVSNYIKGVEDNFDNVVPDEIIFVFAGDMISHQKYSKKYTNVRSKGESISICAKMLSGIMKYFIDKYPNIKYKACNVVGNESSDTEMFMQDKKASFDNADYMIYSLIKSKFENYVEFLNDGDDVVFTFKVQDSNCGVIHGYNQMKMSGNKNIENFFHKMQSVIHKENGVEIDFILLSHIHQHMQISNCVYRGSSWEGSNSYSRYTLGIANSFRSQNMIIIQDGRRHCRAIEF